MLASVGATEPLIYLNQSILLSILSGLSFSNTNTADNMMINLFSFSVKARYSSLLNSVTLQSCLLNNVTDLTKLGRDIPKDSNIIGIANLCDLTTENRQYKKAKDSINNQTNVARYSIGIRTKGDFILDSNLPTIAAHFPLPTLSQSQGSITNMEQRVLPLNASIPYYDSQLQPAYDLSDVAKYTNPFSKLSNFSSSLFFMEFFNIYSAISVSLFICFRYVK